MERNRMFSENAELEDLIMKIDRSRVRKSTSEVPVECQQLIDRLQQCSRTELLEELSKINTWTFGKCELLHWAQVLDIFDRILGSAAEKCEDCPWALKCDSYSGKDKMLLICILRFTSLLIEHSFSRHLYNSMEHLLVLLMANEMNVVLEVLNLLYMFSKRSNFITRLKTEEKDCLLSRLQYLAESWGGKENGFGLADCCNEKKGVPASATTLHVEFHKEDSKNGKAESPKGQKSSAVNIIHIEHIDKLHKTPAEIMRQLVSMYYVPQDKEMWLFTHVRLACQFANFEKRLKNVQARLQALSVLVYSNAIQDSQSNLLYNGLLEELVEVVELSDLQLTDIRCAALRTLTAIIHLDRNPQFPNSMGEISYEDFFFYSRRPGSRLNSIIDVTGASQYHGFLPVLVRNCIASLTSQRDAGSKMTNGPSSSEPGPSSAACDMEKADDLPSISASSDVENNQFPVSLTTALFSFLYHLASYDAGGDALVSCGMMESLLQVINWQGYELDHITFVTRAVRVIDLITNIDMVAFQAHGGLTSFINRLDLEVESCKDDQLYIILPPEPNFDENAPPQPDEEYNLEMLHVVINTIKSCLPQRAALLKSLLNFLKKAFQDATFAESIRHLMEGPLPNALKNIIVNAEYYGPSLFLLATDVVTVYVYQEPALLSALQDNGLTEVVLHALLVKEVPATREVLGSLPNVFSALCLNARGLESFAKHKPFDKLFHILLSPVYLPAMRRRRSAEPNTDTACSLGSAMDELMRHQPSLRQDATLAIISLLEELVYMGTDPKYVCWRPHGRSEVVTTTPGRPAPTEGSSDEEDEDEDETSTSSQNANAQGQAENNSNVVQTPTAGSERQPIALIDYVLNAMKFIDAILSNNSTDDHCREFVQKGGLKPLLQLLGLPNLPADCPVTNPAQAVATVCKSILNLAHEPFLFQEGLQQLSDVLDRLKPLTNPPEEPVVLGGSRLLMELANAPDPAAAFNNSQVTPLLHAMGAAHGYVLMFVHVCRTGQTEIRSLSLQHWGKKEGVKVLRGLAELYTALVWESTLLLAYCSDDLIPSECDFTRESIEKLNHFFDRCETTQPPSENSSNQNSTLDPLANSTMELDGSDVPKPDSRNLKYIKPLLGASSRLGRALAELFGLLVKLSVGSPVRQRRGQNIVAAPPIPTIPAKKICFQVALALNLLLSKGLDCDLLPPSPSPKCRLTFLICSVGFTSPMLFDERRFPYHLMLKKFVTMGGQTVFFKTFKWALNNSYGVGPSDVNTLPDGTLGFLDAWLTLLEKMVNPKAILETPHTITTRPNSLFNFDPLRYLIQIQRLAFDCIERLWKNTPITSYGTRITETVLTILKHFYEGEKIIREKLKEQADSKEQAGPSSSSTAPLTARVNEDSLKQLVDMGFSRESAVEALLHSNTLEQATDYLLSNPPNARASTSNAAEPTDPEDDQMLTAIAISLGINNILENPIATIDEIRDMLDEYGETALSMALDLLDKMPELVHKACELLVTIMKRNGIEYRDALLDSMVHHLTINAQELSQQMYLAELKKIDFKTVAEIQAGKKLANYTHLFILFYEVVSYFEMKLPFMAMYGTPLLDLIIQIVRQAEYLINEAFVESHEVICPKWLAPCLLLIDAYSKVASRTDRKCKMHISTTRIWQWYDLTTGRWTHYSAANNKIINDAYWAGEQKVKVTCGRKRYTITFPNMLQMNEESGNNRPVAMSLLSVNHSSCKNIDEDPPENPLFRDLTEKERSRCIPVAQLSKVQIKSILQVCVRLLHFSLERDVLHSILQLCVRFTRNYDMAKVFVEAGGIKCLLNINYIPDFGGFGVLATILIRHALEEPNTLKFAMEKVIRGRALSTIPPPYRDCVYLCRQLGAAVTRDPDTFYEVSRKILRVDTSVFGYNIDVAIPLRVEPLNRVQRAKAPPLEDKVSIGVLYNLLDELLKPLTKKVETPNKPVKDDESYVPSTAGSFKTTEKKKATSKDESADKEKDKTTSDKKEESNVVKPMLPKSVILKILADAVVSYCPVAKLISEYTYKASIHKPLIKENTSALAFIFDKILPETENLSDSDCSTMCRMFIAALASSNHAPEAQLTLVSEVKAALGRAVSMPESHEKHSQIQHICTIISTMIDNCPVPPRGPSNITPVNNIIKMMIRRGLFNDLAKITHHLDLSSPYTPFTANAALKPLESLSRTINQPGPNTTTAKGRKPSGNTADASTGTSTQNDASNRIDEEDTENAEDNRSEATTEPNENEGDRDRLEEIMEQILNGATERVGANAMDIDDVVPLAFETDRDPTEELMSTDSGESDSNPSDDNDEEGNNDDEDEDDDGVDVNMEDNDENDDENNYEDDENNEGERRNRTLDDNFGTGREFRVGTNDRDEDVLMIHYENENESGLPRMIRWNENGFTVPMLDDNSGDHVIIHPLLLSRNNGDATQNAVSRGQRTNRPRRYQYLLNARNPNPPVILQRLLGTQDPHAMANMMTANNILAAPTDMAAREQARVVIMDNFGIIPPNEEQIDFVDQSGYLFGPSLAATLSHVPPVVHWWNMESKLLDLESVFDCASWICNRLMPNLIKHMNEDLKKKKAKEDEKEAKNRKKVPVQNENLNENKEDSHHTYSSLLSELPDDGEDAQPFLFNYADEVENDQTLGNDDDDTTHTEQPPVNNSTGRTMQTNDPRRSMIVRILPQRYRSDSPSEDSDSNRERDGSSEHHPADVTVDVSDVLVEQNRENFSQIANRIPARAIELRRNNIEPIQRVTDEDELVLQPYYLPNRDDNSFDSQASLPEENNSSNNSNGNSSTAVQVQSDRGTDTIERLTNDDNISTAELESNESFNPFEMRLSNDGDYHRSESSEEPPWSPVRRNRRSLRTFFEAAFGQHLDIERMHAEGESSSSSSDQNTQPEDNRNNPDDTDAPQSSLNSAPSETREAGEGASSIQLAATASNSAGPSSAPDDEEIPEGVDPSFLEALPPEIRREVLEQHRILTLQQRLAARTAEPTNSATNTNEESNSNEVPQEVSPEFLAALPPALQEEVLTQQRLEQQRQAAARAPPNEPVDAHAFFQTLQPSLRTMILSDMEDSQINALPPELAAEAQHLRRDWYARNRQMAHERFMHSNLPTIIRQNRGGRTGHRPITFQRAGWPQWSRDFMSASTVRTTSQARIKGRQLLDHEGIACLLILLFTDDPHLNKLRLHRVIRNLCYHGPTRDWVINALLTVVEKSVNERPDEGMLRPLRKGPRAGPLSSKLQTDHRHLNTGGHWLTIRMEAALGCAANVFLVAKGAGKKSDRFVGSHSIGIHPQAAPIVCRNALDLFTALAKTFPSCMLPIRIFKEDAQLERNYVGPVKLNNYSAPDFWDVLLKLDNMGHRKGKALQKSSLTAINIADKDTLTFDNTVFGRLLNMLGSPTIHRNTQLTDNLLKLLSVTTQGMPELIKPVRNKRGHGNESMNIANNPPINSLSLAVNVITYKNCSEEGLEFITNLLLNLAASSQDMSFMILNLLVNGAVKIGLIVEKQINNMLRDLTGLNNKKKEEKDKETPSTSKGVIYNRFTNEQVIVTASSKIKTACELQLPSMVPLISKSSSQIFFLRVLRVIVQIRNSIKNSIKRNNLPMDLAALSDQLFKLEDLWETLSQCLFELEHAPDHHAVLVLQPTVEAFFLVHSPQQGQVSFKDKKDDEEAGNSTENQENPEAAHEPQTERREAGTGTGSGSESCARSLSFSPENVSTPLNSDETVRASFDFDHRQPEQRQVTPEQQKFLAFAEKHRTVLNQILRQSTAHLADGPFAVLVDHTRILDFDIKRRYFRTELERMDHGIRREETAVHVRRNNVFEDSFRELFRRAPEEWKNRFYIVFEEEEGQDAGGLLREWYVIISRDIFNPMYALFTVSPGDRVTYMINSASHYNSNHLCYYKFVGRVIAKAIYDNKLLECYFTRSFYKHILGIPVKYTDMESEDYSFYRGLIYLMENNMNNLGLDLTFSTEISEFGVTETRDLIANGRHIPVTEENKMEYVRLVCQMKMTGAIKQQLSAFLDGFYDIIPMRLISIFNEQELELLISGLPNVDIDDLKANTEYHKYLSNSLQIQWFWRALRSFDQADRAKFLQFVTGTSKVPLQGFGALEGMNGVQKFQIHRDDRSTDRLPSAHTCFNQLDLPVYETYDKLRAYLLKAIHECSEGFGFA
ncbi:E3 ubiquitin-protein ligase HUWE1 isoform X3 [Anthonomus grandis grandis]|uniref:E3 ubiquitin-protein ligase HUWE1 isoform X3 n=1 Tax=Anthonomus grandis grandis TaxID=2921223 RepID=UPI002165F074|nr:E3 ubiquitin-protein ligase HUWE1 isoform X3 [Anthonomus grandis grandis]